MGKGGGGLLAVCLQSPSAPPTRGAPHAQDVAEALFSANASNHTT